MINQRVEKFFKLCRYTSSWLVIVLFGALGLLFCIAPIISILRGYIDQSGIKIFSFYCLILLMPLVGYYVFFAISKQFLKEIANDDYEKNQKMIDKITFN